MKNKKWDFQKLQKEALKYKTRSEFSKLSSSAYVIARKSGILDIICSHMPNHVSMLGKNNPSFKWTDEDIKKEALKYKTKKEFRKNAYGAYQAAAKRGFFEEACKHMLDGLKRGESHPCFKWTEEKIQLEASKYKTRFQFQKNSPAYKAAVKRNILDKVCAHMPKQADRSKENSPAFKWSKEKIIKEAIKHKTRSDFFSNAGSAYNMARKMGIFEEVCTHMKLSGVSSRPEKSLLSIIKHNFPKAQTLRDRKVKIENKPHIQGFDLDIYIPELRKAIEFDGEYWHSVDGLKRSRSHWPQKDIEEYHKIKDNYFSSKGIKIFHVEEKNWVENQQACIDQCLEFLGINQVKVA